MDQSYRTPEPPPEVVLARKRRSPWAICTIVSVAAGSLTALMIFAEPCEGQGALCALAEFMAPMMGAAVAAITFAIGAAMIVVSRMLRPD